jgi:hypothetical protein
MSNPPAVSVVIPTFNQPVFLLEALESVFVQTFEDYEVVVVNDGSTDDTLDQLAPLQSRHGRRLRVITQPNAGTGAARNHGIELSLGKYVALLDHDDLWMPAKLAAQVKFLEEHPRCAAAVVPYASSRQPGHGMFDPAALTDAEGIVQRPFRKLAEKHALLTTCSVLMFARERARGLRFGTERGIIEDVQFQIGLLARGALGVAGRELQAVYRFHDSNTSAQAPYFYGGIKLLRRLDREGRFDELSALQRTDMLAWLGFIGRAAAVTQLLQRRRLRGLEIYCRELRHQLREGRLDFALAYPAMALLPGRLTQAWSHRGTRE